MAQNEMKAKPALPERVRSMEGLGVVVISARWNSGEPLREGEDPAPKADRYAIVEFIDLRISIGREGIEASYAIFSISSHEGDERPTRNYLARVGNESVHLADINEAPILIRCTNAEQVLCGKRLVGFGIPKAIWELLAGKEIERLCAIGCHASRRLTFDMSGSRRRRGLGPE